MVKEFPLPDMAASAQSLIDAMGGGPLDAIHDFGQPKRISLRIFQSTNYHVDMVRHHYKPMQMIFDALIMQAMF